MKKINVAVVGLISVVTVVAFQNCSKMQFQEGQMSSSESSSNVLANSGNPAPLPIVSASAKDVILPSLVADEQAGVSKLLIFIGGVASEQTATRQKLVSKLDSLVDGLRGRDVEIIVTNLTKAYNTGEGLTSLLGRADGGEVIKINENLPLTVLAAPGSSYGSETLAKFKPYFGKDILTKSEHVPDFYPSRWNNFKISRAQWDKDYSDIKANLTKAIMNTSDVSHVNATQSYLCKVTQFLADTRADAIVKPTDKLGIIIVSDKDDGNTGLAQGPENCPLVSKSVKSIYPEFTWYMGARQDVSGTAPIYLMLKETDFLPDSADSESCISSNLPDADLCSSGFYCGQTYYTNILDYADKKMGDKYKPGICVKTYEEGFHRMEMSGLPRRLWDGKKPYMGRYLPLNKVDVDYTFAYSQADITKGGIALGFSNYVKAKFGKNVHISMIINPTDGTCGATVAKRYSNVASYLGAQGQVFPLCKLGE